MTDRLALLTISLSFILQNVWSQSLDFNVSAPLDHTLNEDGSVSVTCKHDEKDGWEWDAKLKIKENEVVCEVLPKNMTNAKCEWEREGNNKFKFTLRKLEASHKEQLFFCEISRVNPIPVIPKKGQKTKLFQGYSIHFPPPRRTCSCPSPTSKPQKCPPADFPINKYTILICGMIVVVVLLSVYSAIITGVYFRLRVAKVEFSDTPTYVPMKRKVKPHDADNTEYVDMREVQKQGHIRDINYNC